MNWITSVTILIPVVISTTLFNNYNLFENGYIVDNNTNCNSVQALQPSYRELLSFNFTSTEQCLKSCLSTPNCTSYTYIFSNNTVNGFNATLGQCWIFKNNPIWLPYPTTYSDCGRIIYPCKNNGDCSLNGVCNSDTGVCNCNKGWNGYKCDNMTLLAANKSSGYQYLSESNISSWGGSVQYDYNSGKYIMLVAELANHCGIDSWGNNCQIVYAESEATGINGWNSKYIRKNTLVEPYGCTPDLLFVSKSLSDYHSEKMTKTNTSVFVENININHKNDEINYDYNKEFDKGDLDDISGNYVLLYTENMAGSKYQPKPCITLTFRT